MRQVDAVVVGAGFGGLYMVHKLRGLGFEVQGFERGSDVGGTWYWNRYPGARCDVESLYYSYSFDPELEQEWEWTERFATQPEILRYLSHVADRYDLRPSFQFDTSVAAARWSAGDRRWIVQTGVGDEIAALFLILATGSLSAVKPPDIAGVEDFAGPVLHTSSWPDDVDLSGKRVGVIGTGSSGIQAIPMIAAQAAHLTVFQRTASFTVPARNAPLAPEAIADYKSRYRELREAARNSSPGTYFASTGKRAAEFTPEERETAFEQAWAYGGPSFSATVTDMILDRDANASAADFVRRKIGATVADPDTARSLTPTGFPIGSKRLAVDTDYYETFNRPNVTLKDLRRTPLTRIVAEGVETSDGVTPLDVLVLATGFDAMTGSFTRIRIEGEGGVTLKDKWSAGPLTYLGLMSQGFPNLFLIAGPGSPSVLSNMVLSVEQHVEWIADCLADMRAKGLRAIEPEPEAEQAWVARVNAGAAKTLYMEGDSWYLGANVPGKPRVFMPFIGGVHTYRRICDEVAANDYAGFARA
jgi:cyclohexanone monooxygenase